MWGALDKRFHCQNDKGVALQIGNATPSSSLHIAALQAFNTLAKMVTLAAVSP